MKITTQQNKNYGGHLHIHPSGMQKRVAFHNLHGTSHKVIRMLSFDSILLIGLIGFMVRVSLHAEPGVITKLAQFNNLKLIVSEGLNPVWSPSSRYIIFGKGMPGFAEHDIWIVSRDGQGVRKLFSDARDPQWSPDGRMIAFIRHDRKIMIYNMAQSKEFELFFYKDWNVEGLMFTVDGKGLVFKAANIQYLLNLDDLQVKEITTEQRQIEGHPGEIHSPVLYESPAETEPGFRLLCHAEANPFSQNVAYTDGSLPTLGDNFGYAFPGIWAVNKDNRYLVRLWAKECTGVAYAPDLIHVAIAGQAGIYIGQLSERSTPWNKKYSMPIVSGNNVNIGDNFVIYAKKVNPLNNKIVGFNERDVKGALRVIEVREKEALAELVEYTGKPIFHDDVVASEFIQVSNVFAQGERKHDYWATVQNPLTMEEIGKWEPLKLKATGVEKTLQQIPTSMPKAPNDISETSTSDELQNARPQSLLDLQANIALITKELPASDYFGPRSETFEKDKHTILSAIELTLAKQYKIKEFDINDYHSGLILTKRVGKFYLASGTIHSQFAIAVTSEGNLTKVMVKGLEYHEEGVNKWSLPDDPGSPSRWFLYWLKKSVKKLSK